MSKSTDILIRFHEIGLKGKNQPLFVRHLAENLRRVTAGLGVEEVQSVRMMIKLKLSENADCEQVIKTAQTVFGAVKISPAIRVASEYQAITEAAINLANLKPFSSFRISANRADKKFHMNSNELNVSIGQLIATKFKAKVDLSNPELNIHIEIQKNDSFVYSEDYRGAGGLPVGTAGKVAVLMSGGIDSPVAAWRMLKRGCKAVLVHFHSFPLVEGRSREKAQELARVLNLYQYDTKLFLVPFAEIQKRILLEVPGPLRVVAYRRLMIQITEAIAKIEGAKALVTGESVGQVGSQTLQNISTVSEPATLPIFRPLIGMDKIEIIDQAKAIETYSISILPDEDCCTLFVPKSPSTAVKPYEIVEYEKKLPIKELISNALHESELFEYHLPSS